MCREAAWAEPAAKVTGVVSGSKQDVRIKIELKRRLREYLFKENICRLRKGVIAEAVIPFLKYR